MAFNLRKLVTALPKTSSGVVPRFLSSEAPAASAAAQELPNLFLQPEKSLPPPLVATTLPWNINEKGNVEVPIVSMNAEATGQAVEVHPSLLNAPLRKDILQRVVKWQLACRRQGTHKTKSRSEVSGSTRKPWKQKGTGRARVGDIRAPQWRGGYTVHGPKPRDYSYSLPKKVRSMGLRVALSAKLREGRLAVVDEMTSEELKTKHLNELLNKNGWGDALFIDADEFDKNFELATRNIPKVDLIPHQGTNVYSILKRDLVILSVDALKKLEDRLSVD